MEKSNIIEKYYSGMTIQEIANSYGFSSTKIRNFLLKNGVELRMRGQQYVLPDKLIFARDCAMLRWHELEEKYGVSWSIIKSWKKKYGLTTGKKENRAVVVSERDGDCWWCVSHKFNEKRGGYPRCKGGQLVVARLWIEKNGVWPVGKLVRHLCAHGWCVNPSHIVPGTQFENLVDTVLDGFGKKDIAYMNSLLSRAFKEGVISFNEDGKVLRTVDGKIFDIVGRVDVELKIIYSGNFERLHSRGTLSCMNKRGDVPLAVSGR